MVCLFIELLSWFKLHILIEVKVFRRSVFRGSVIDDSPLFLYPRVSHNFLPQEKTEFGTAQTH